MIEAIEDSYEEDSYDQVEQAMAEFNTVYLTKWPKSCIHCNGWGANSWQENQSPLGSGEVWLETLSEPCDHCTAEGKCARCGESGLNPEGEGPCSHCGWNYDTGLQGW